MGGYGYEIVHTLIVDIEPDPRVKAAMNDINAGNMLPTWNGSNFVHHLSLFSELDLAPCFSKLDNSSAP